MLRFADLATDGLAAAREEIDALNVYPVPDGDTGTNMFLTMSAGRDALRAQAAADPGADLVPAMQALARGTLLGARGNSGVILSQILGAVAGRIARATHDERAATVLAEALHQATEASYAAVGRPVEGTILTVMRAASEAAAPFVGDPDARSRHVAAAAAAAAREALARTPDQLAVLREAGVVNAYVVMRTEGLCVVLDLTAGRLPAILHWGADLGRLSGDDVAALALAGVPPIAINNVDEPVRVAVLPEHHTGWVGRPGLSGSRSGRDWSPRFTTVTSTVGSRLDSAWMAC